MALYPVNLDVRGQLCVIVGGGTVASRKLESLLPCGAEIRVISPIVVGRIAKQAEAGLIDWQQRAYRSGDVQGAKLVFAATDNGTTQKQIVADADAAGILVNVIDMPKHCSFQVPASLRHGDLLLTAATGGGSPALAARIRKEFAGTYGSEYGTLVALMAGLRTDVVGLSDEVADHKQMFENLLDSDILLCIKEKRWEDLNTLLRTILPAEIDVLSLVKAMQDTSKEQIN